MPLKFYKLFLKIGVLASFISWFLVAKSMYFLYITGKQIYFNILIEICLVLFISMLIKYPETRPKKSWITWGFTAFLGALLLSSIFGVDFNLSFWGDTERMLGWFSLVHFFALYLIIITVFKTKADWHLLFNGAIVSAVALSLYAFMTYDGNHGVGNVNMTSNISTLGNATYVAGVMLFAFWFAVYELFKMKNWLAKFGYIVAIGLILGGFFFADVSGSQAGLGISMVVFGCLLGMLNKDKVIRQKTWLGLGVFLAVMVLLFTFRSAPIFDGTKMGKVLRDFSMKNGTLNTRLYAWRAGGLGFLEHPILGSGYGNYALLFDKYFIGSYYQWTTTEEYFDRAHNNLVDLAATGGALSLLTYLSIFVAVILAVRKAYKNGNTDVLEVAMIGAVFTAYFIHNLAVFDAIANYILLVISLGFVYFLASEKESVVAELYHQTGNKMKKVVGVETDEDWQFGGREVGSWLLGCFVFGFFIFYYNVNFVHALQASLPASVSWSYGGVQQVYEKWEKALSFNTPIDRDLRAALADQLTSNAPALANDKTGYTKKLFDLAIEYNLLNWDYNPKDSLANMWLARLYYYRGMIYRDTKDIQEALFYIDQTIANGGQHIPPVVFKVGILNSVSKNEEASTELKKAIAWYPKYYDLYCYLSENEMLRLKRFNNDTLASLSLCLDNSARAAVLDTAYFGKAGDMYRKNKDFAHLARLFEVKYVNGSPRNEKDKTEAIKYYKLAGNAEKIEVLEASK